MKKVAVAVLVVLLVTAVAVPALADDEANEGPVLTPGSPVYFLQGILENVQLNLMRNPEARALFMADLVERRSREIGRTIAEEREDLVPGLIHRTAVLAARLDAEAAEVDLQQADATGLAEAMEGATSKALGVLGKLLEDMDENDHPARFGLTTAVDAVGGNGAIAESIFQRILDGDIPGDAQRARDGLERMRDQVRARLQDHSRIPHGLFDNDSEDGE